MVEIGLRSVVLLAFVALVSWVLRRGSAALRHRVWALGFVGLIALPLLCLRLPTLELPRPPMVAGSPSPRPASTLAGPTKGPKPIVESPFSSLASGEAISRAGAAPEPASSRIPLAEPWLDLWGAGVVLAFLRLLAMLAVAARLGRGGEDLGVDPGFGLPAHTRLRRAPEVDVPLTLGYLRPTILLPSVSSGWPAERLRTVLLHEGAHVRRGDWAWLVLSQAVCALYWPNPLVWWAAARLRTTGEMAADDAVLRAGIDAPRYASTLVDLATEARRRHLAALPIVERGTLKARVAAALGVARRSPLNRRGALATLLLVGAAAVPIAAAHLAEATLRSRVGVLDLGEDGWIAVVAISEVEKGKTRSWDANGALLSQPYVVGKEALAWFEHSAVPPGSVARYVFLRAKLTGGAPVPSFTDRSGGEFLSTYPYGHTGDDAFSVEDPQGAEYRVVRLDIPRGQEEARLFARVATGPWTRYADADFRGGERSRVSLPDAGVKLTPALPSRPWRTELAFTLPETFKDRVSRILVTPGSGVHLMEGTVGDQTDYLETPIESVRRVEILSRKTLPVLLDGLPMRPKAGARPLSRSVVPPGTIDAKGGKARLPDGSTLTFEGVWDAGDPKANGWTASGAPWVRPDFAALANGNRPVRDDGLKERRFLIRRTGHRENVQSWVYDGDGLAAPSGYTSENVAEGRTEIGFGMLVGSERSTLDLLFRIAPVPYRTIAEGTLGTTPGYRGFHRKGNRGPRTFSVEFPRALLARMKGVDVSLVPLDERGREVRNANGGISSSRTTSDGGENVVEYDLGPAEERRVRRLALRTRPWTWVRFPGIRLKPDL